MSGVPPGMWNDEVQSPGNPTWTSRPVSDSLPRFPTTCHSLSGRGTHRKSLVAKTKWATSTIATTDIPIARSQRIAVKMDRGSSANCSAVGIELGATFRASVISQFASATNLNGTKICCCAYRPGWTAGMPLLRRRPITTSVSDAEPSSSSMASGFSRAPKLATKTRRVRSRPHTGFVWQRARPVLWNGRQRVRSKNLPHGLNPPS